MGLFENLSNTSPFLSKQAFAFDGNETKEKELELWKRFKNGDAQAGKELRYSLRPLRDKAIRMTNKVSGDVTNADLQVVAAKEMNNILLRYDPNQGALSTWVINQLVLRLNNAIYEMAPGSHVSRPDLGKLGQVTRAEMEAKTEYGPNVTAAHISKFLPETLKWKDDLNEIERIRKYQVKDLIGDATFRKDEDSGDVTFKEKYTNDFSHDLEEDQDHSFQLDKMEQLAKEKLTPQEYEIIKHVLFEGETSTSYALRTGIGTSPIVKAKKKWKEVLEQHPNF